MAFAVCGRRLQREAKKLAGWPLSAYSIRNNDGGVMKGAGANTHRRATGWRKWAKHRPVVTANERRIVAMYYGEKLTKWLYGGWQSRFLSSGFMARRTWRRIKSPGETAQLFSRGISSWRISLLAQTSAGCISANRCTSTESKLSCAWRLCWP